MSISSLEDTRSYLANDVKLSILGCARWQAIDKTAQQIGVWADVGRAVRQALEARWTECQPAEPAGAPLAGSARLGYYPSRPAPAPRRPPWWGAGVVERGGLENRPPPPLLFTVCHRCSRNLRISQRRGLWPRLILTSLHAPSVPIRVPITLAEFDRLLERHHITVASRAGLARPGKMHPARLGCSC